VDGERARLIRRASWIGIFGNALLSALKIATGLTAGSLSVLADGIDTFTDIATSAITLLAAHIIVKPPDVEHPYGHTRAETLATKVLSFIIFFAGAQMVLTAGRRLISGEPTELPDPLAIVITLVSIAGKVALAWSQLWIGRKAGSAMLAANGRNMQNDILISVGVLIGLAFTHLLHLPVLDVVAALLVGAWIMRTAFGIFMETNMELMDGMQDPTVYPTIFQAVDSVSGALNPHRTRVRRLANMYVIDLDVEVDGSITVSEAHGIAVQVERTIKDRLDNVYDVIVHVEPLGNVERDERFGLSGDGKG
jgi:cation diffusion facilitator family transporter